MATAHGETAPKRSAGYWQLVRDIRAGRYDEATEEEKDRAARELIRECSLAASVIALQPVPLLDLRLLAPVHHALIEAIARIHGHQVDRRSVVELLKAWRADLLLPQATLAASKFVPAVGWAISARTAHAITYALGMAAHTCFRRCFPRDPTACTSELRSMIHRLYREGFERVRRT
jgi:uncharacterized protein (DUF697 family)